MICSFLPLFYTSHVLQESQIKIPRGLIAPLTPEDNRKGGGPWTFRGFEQDDTLLLKTFTVWVAHNTIRALELTLSDDWTGATEGSPEDNNEGTYLQWSRSHGDVGRVFSMVFV